MQFNMDQTTPHEYLVREEDTVLRNRRLNKLKRLDKIVYGTPLS